mmetsp:Transcript_53301/g.143720  ORF Transcript_53301/g.143720 Transcript_53301/m.143720 type:complete len:80 (-) Transcript_53301:232-471(-)
MGLARLLPRSKLLRVKRSPSATQILWKVRRGCDDFCCSIGSVSGAVVPVAKATKIEKGLSQCIFPLARMTLFSGETGWR